MEVTAQGSDEGASSTFPAVGAAQIGGSSAVKQQLESLVSEMIEKGILFTDAKREFEKKFIASVLEQHRGNLSRAAKDLRIHRNTLGKKIEEYKL